MVKASFASDTNCAPFAPGAVATKTLMGNFIHTQGPSGESLTEMKLSPVMGTGVITGFLTAGGATVGTIGTIAVRLLAEALDAPEDVLGTVCTVTGERAADADDVSVFGTVGTMTGLNGSVAGNCSGSVETGGSEAMDGAPLEDVELSVRLFSDVVVVPGAVVLVAVVVD